MGLLSSAKEKIEEAQEVLADSPYDISVNRGSMSQNWFRRHAAEAWANGYKLHSIFEQDGNTVMIWEKRSDG